jgi:transcriptional regulator with XRE-family HTH domain
MKNRLIILNVDDDDPPFQLEWFDADERREPWAKEGEKSLNVLGEKLLAIRFKLEASRSQLAKLLEFDKGVARISEYERGIREPDLMTLVKYSKLASTKFDAEKPRQKFAKMFMKADTADQPETTISESSSKRSTNLGRRRTSAHSRATTNINSRSSARANVLRARHLLRSHRC